MKGLLIEHVAPGSIAEEFEIEPGDRLVAINGHAIRDIIDFHFYGGEDDLLLEIEKQGGEVWEVEVEREEHESLGLFFPAPKPKRCGNNCVFCFVHQLPPGMRAPLYVKDEDYRLSFLYGNYVTLANISAADLRRIKEQRLSPLYVSVHATEPDLREKLLGKSGIRPILPLMKELAAAGIMMHTQIVLCPGLNDGEHLKRTVEDLAVLHPHVASLAVVPIGLTRHRNSLPLLNPVTEEYAKAFLPEWDLAAQALAERLGEPFLFFSDEFYLKACRPFPPLASYGDFPQLENGVGMIPLFVDEAETVVAEAEPLQPFRATVVTGISPLSYISDFCRKLSERTCVSIAVEAVTNRLFGEQVTVSGLVTGEDIVAELKGKELGDVVIIPEVMLKEGEGVFLDDLSLEDLSAELCVKVVSCCASAAGIYEALRQHLS